MKSSATYQLAINAWRRGIKVHILTRSIADRAPARVMPSQARSPLSGSVTFQKILLALDIPLFHYKTHAAAQPAAVLSQSRAPRVNAIRRPQVKLRHLTLRHPALAKQLHHVLLTRLAQHHPIERERVPKANVLSVLATQREVDNQALDARVTRIDPPR